IASGKKRIRCYSSSRKRGKGVRVIEWIYANNISEEELMKELKTKLACGGTIKEGHIELQGDHRSRVKEVLIGMGFSPEMIDLK
ncbi:MAG: hypothetical protein QXG38_03355, partial [Candidatus Hadarchaeales archaeon]